MQECVISTERNEPLFVDFVIMLRILADIFNREFGVEEKTFKEIKDSVSKEEWNFKLMKNSKSN